MRMLKIDYEINTDEGIEVLRSTPPDYLRQIDGNIALIEGPGSSGKSTLLNIIAYGCFGDKNPNIAPSIKVGIEDLKSDYRGLKFDMEFTEPKTSTTLRIKRELNGTVEIYENGSTRCLTQREFDSKYRLVYDIPDDPTKRLKNITEALLQEDRRIESKIDSFSESTKSIRDSLKSVVSEEEISKMENDNEWLISENKRLYDRKKEALVKISQCDQALLYHKYNGLKKSIDNTSGQLDAEKRKPERPKTTGEVRSSALKQWVKRAESVRISPSLHNEIVSTKNDKLIQRLKEVEEVWQNVNFEDIESSRDFVKSIKRLLPGMSAMIPDNSENKESILAVNDILQILDHYESSLSLGEVGSIAELRTHLLKFKEDNNLIDYSNIHHELLKLIKNSRGLDLILDKYEEAYNSGDQPQIPCRNNDRISELTSRLRSLENEMSVLKSELVAHNMVVERIEADFQRICHSLNGTYRISSEELEEMKVSSQNDLSSTTQSISLNENKIERNREKIEKYKGQPKPKFYDHQSKLNNILDACRNLKKNLKTTNDRINKINHSDRSEYERDPSAYDPIWNYLGSILRTVRHMGKTYEVTSVNLFDGIKGTITTVEGRVIRISSMGTGEGQQSYLRGLLSVTDDRMVIAMFDEVANMSQSILSEVVDDLIGLQNEGKLLLGLMVEPNDNPKVTTYGIQ